jgi:hypothetical protein
MYSIKMCVFVIFTSLLTGCISTDVRDFTDPEYNSYKVKKMLLVTPNPTFDDIFISELRSKNINTEVVTSSQIFLPTRSYSKNDMSSLIASNKFDAILYIVVNGESSNSQVVSYLTNSSAQVYSTGYGSASATGTSTTTPIMAFSRDTSSKAELFDPINSQKIWVANLQTSAQGAIYVQSDDTMESISEEVINSLIKKNHISK